MSWEPDMEGLRRVLPSLRAELECPVCRVGRGYCAEHRPDHKAEGLARWLHRMRYGCAWSATADPSVMECSTDHRQQATDALCESGDDVERHIHTIRCLDPVRAAADCDVEDLRAIIRACRSEGAA